MHNFYRGIDLFKLWPVQKAESLLSYGWPIRFIKTVVDIENTNNKNEKGINLWSSAARRAAFKQP